MKKTVQLEGKNFLVYGAGISGIAAAGLLVRQGFSVVLCDGNENQEQEEIRAKSKELEKVSLGICRRK